MAPRILFVDHSGVMGGAEFSLLDIARHVDATGRVVLFEPGPFRDRLAAENIDVEILDAPQALLDVSRSGTLLDDLRAVPGVARLAWTLGRRARDVDVLYANSQKAMVVAALASAWTRRPLIWHLRDLLTDDHFSALHRRLVTRVANTFATRVIANSHATADAFSASGGTAPVSVVWNGIDPAPFEAAHPSDAARTRRELGVTDAPLIGVFSRLARWKGQHVLLQALRRLPEAHALVVGDALFPDDNAYKVELKAQIQRLGLAPRVHFLGFRDDVPRLMTAVDVVAHTSVAPEPFGRVVVEGMLAQRPVVATNTGGVPEIIDDSRTGWLVPPADPDALADALSEVLAHPEEARTIAQAGHAAALEHFTAAAMVQQVEREIHHVLEG